MVERKIPPRKTGRGYMKVEYFGFGDFVWKQYALEGKTVSYITKLCNQKLDEEGFDTKHRLNQMNVLNYIRKAEKELGPTERQRLVATRVDEIVDVITKLKLALLKAEQLLDEAFEAGNIKRFTEVHKALHDDLKLLATIQGRLKIPVTLELMHRNIDAILEVIKAAPDILPEIKRRILLEMAEKVVLKEGKQIEI